MVECFGNSYKNGDEIIVTRSKYAIAGSNFGNYLDQ